MSENIKVTFDTAEEDLHVNLDAGAIMYGKMQIGTTTTGESGTEAKVENVGSQTNAILNFTIPKGDRGEQGIQGIQGERGLDGLGVPAGGATGQVLAKKSGNDNDTEWVDFVNGVKDIPANTNVDEFHEEGIYAWNGDDGKAITGLPATFSGVDIPQCEYILKVTKLSSRTTKSGKLMETYEYNFSFAGILLYTQVRTVYTTIETGHKAYADRVWRKIAMSDENGLVVSNTKPTIETEQSKVWLQKNKNLFNKNNFLPNSSTSAEGVLISNNSTNTYYIPVEYGNSYIMSFVNNGVSGNVLYGFCDTQPSLGVSCTYNVATADKLNKMVFTPTSESNKYLCIRLRYDDAQIPYMSNIQVEQGTTATSYEENARSAIYTKEINNKYEKFTETVAISSHQPINQNGLWLQKGKNLFNKNGTTIIDQYIDGGTGEIKTYANGTKMFVLEVQPSTSYTISKTQGGHFRVGTTNNYPSVGTIVDGLINNSSATSITITTNSTAKYLCCSYWQTGVDTITEGSIRESIQVEQGTTATTFEEYKDKKIYTKTDNGVYEEFINADDLILNQFKINDKNNITDFNSFTKNGFYMINVQKCSNAPNQYATGMLLVFGSYYISQLYIADLNGTTVGYIRMSSDKGATWNSWSQITTDVATTSLDAE